MVFRVAMAKLASLAGQGLTRNGSALDVTSIPVRKADGTTVYGKWAVVRVVGPASYVAGGFQVDCSSFFSSIVAAQFCRRFSTGTGISTPAHPATPSEDGTDLYSNAKFRAIAYRAPAHTHTFDKYNADTSLLGSGTTYTSTATGGTSATQLAEAAAGTDMSTTTYEFLVIGVPV